MPLDQLLFAAHLLSLACDSKRFTVADLCTTSQVAIPAATTLCSFGTASDPLLLYISSFLASHTTLRPEPTAPYQHLDSGSGNSNSGASSAPGGGPAFSPETHMWQLRWDELQIERPIGHGSFGAVYKARWQETTVAVKVLIDKGA